MGHSDVYTQIYEVVRQIPFGTVLTYGAVARRTGLPHGARQVGYAMRRAPGDLPWHRVVAFSRKGYGKISISDPVTAMTQQELLKSEGIHFTETGELALCE